MANRIASFVGRSHSMLRAGVSNSNHTKDAVSNLLICLVTGNEVAVNGTVCRIRHSCECYNIVHLASHS